jgi:hypothetical protein
MRRLMITFAAAVAVTLAGAGTAWAHAGSGPAQQANCVGMANAGGGNGVFESQLATSSPGAAGALARLVGTSGGLGLPASHNDCSLP